MLSSQTAADTVKDTHYAATKALAQARIAGYDAKANESLTLVYRGTGQAYETTWKNQYQVATDNLAAARNAGVTDDAGSKALKAWESAHKQIRTLDDSGRWDDAVRLATQNVDGSSAKAFAGFETATQKALPSEAQAVSEGLAASHTLLVMLGWLTLVLGLVAAVLAWRGISERLEEYR